jgi:hypothetical protein
LLRAGAACLGSALATPGLAAIVNAPALLENEVGGVRVLPAGGVFCGGVLPVDGHEVVHALLNEWLPLAEAWARIDAYLDGIGRPPQALCGLELRTPQQLTFEGFRMFNAPYIEQLRKRSLMIGNYSAVCRTNVVPAANAPKTAMVHAFSYTAPAPSRTPTFCISGAADLDARGKVVAEGDTSPAGMRQRLQHCVSTISERLAQLGLGWEQTTHTDLSLAGESVKAIDAEVLNVLPAAALKGLRLYNARPPITGTEVELECRAASLELTLTPR